MNRFFKVVLTGISAWAVSLYRQTFLDFVKIQASILYLRGVKIARDVCRSVVALAALLLVALMGCVLVHVGLFVLLPPPFNGIVLLALGFVYIVVGLCGIRRLISADWWLKIMQADSCMDAAEESRKP